MDGTVCRKDALHNNTLSNNLAKSAAVGAIKACLEEGVVAVNSGNHALLQVGGRVFVDCGGVCFYCECVGVLV